MNCKDCYHFVQEFTSPPYNHIQCELDNLLHNPTGCGAEICPNYNKDLSQEKICLNCDGFLGGGDWGLSCKKDYYTLTDALNGTCEKFERIRGQNE